MDTQHISPRMLEAGEASARAAIKEEWLKLDSDLGAARLAEAIYLAMRAKLVESRGGE